MNTLAGTALTAVGLFVATNIDGLVVLTALFIAAESVPRSWWAVLIGQYVGLVAVIVVSGLAATGLSHVPSAWVGLLGVVPILLGLRGLWLLLRHRADGSAREAVRRPGVVAAAAAALASGVDNVAVYTAALHEMGPRRSAVAVAVFVVLTAVWCAIAGYLGGHQRIAALTDSVAHLLVPVFLIGVGCILLLTAL